MTYKIKIFKILFSFLFFFFFISSNAQKNPSYYLDDLENPIKLDRLDQKLKYVLNNEFSKLVTGSNSNGLGNYASFSTVEKTFSASLNFIQEKGIIDINISGETNDGVTSIFSGNNFNSGINIRALYHLYIGKQSIDFDYSTFDKINFKHKELAKKKLLEKEKVRAKLFALNKESEEKNKELKEVLTLIKNNNPTSEFYENNKLKKEIIYKEIINLKSKISYYQSESNFNIHINSLREKRDDVNNKDPFKHQKFKLDSLKSFNYVFNYKQEIKAKQQELNNIEEYFRKVSNISLKKIYQSKLVLIKKEDSIINQEIELYKKKSSTIEGLVGLQIQEEINSNLKRIKEVKTEKINITWLTFGGGIGYDSYDLFDANREFDEQIFEKEDLTPSFSLAISKYTNQSLFNSKKTNSRNVNFISFGVDVKIGNNISTFLPKDVITVDEVSNTRTLVTKEDALVGAFEDNIVASQLYLDYYKFIGNKDNIGIHLRGVKNISDLNSTSSFRFGAIIPFVNRDDKSSFLNLEVFYSINDVFEKSKEDSPLRKNILGIQTTLPFNFKIL